MARRWPLLGVGLAALWLFVRGVALTPNRILAEFFSGLLVGLPIAYLLRRFYVPTCDLRGAVRGVPPALAYAALFAKELITANVDVAYRVLAPSMPIDPDVLEVPLRVESDLAITTIANSITLTPGTLTMDYDEETNTLYVHGINCTDRESVVAPIRAWEDYALRIFDEERDPGDPVPPRPSVGTAPTTGESGELVPWRERSVPGHGDDAAPADPEGNRDRDRGEGEAAGDGQTEGGRG